MESEKNKATKNTQIMGLEFNTLEEANVAYDQLKATNAFSTLLICQGALIVRNQ